MTKLHWALLIFATFQTVFNIVAYERMKQVESTLHILVPSP